MSSISSKNIITSSVFIFVVFSLIGYQLGLISTHHQKAHLSIEQLSSSNIVYVKGSDFPATGTATINTTFATSTSPSTTQSRSISVKGGNFAVAFVAQQIEKLNYVKATATLDKTVAAATKYIDEPPQPVDIKKLLPTTSTTIATPQTTIPQSPQAGYKLVFADNFDGSSLNQNNWGVYEGKGNEGVGYRVRSAVTVGDGELKITGNDMNGGGLATKLTQTYGYFEIRSRFDANSVGYNTATLLWPQSERWPVDGEIDISEMSNGNTGRNGSYVHWGSNNQQTAFEQNGDFSQWHTFGVDWQPDHLTYYLDGNAFWTVTNPAAIPHNPHFLALQLDVNKNQPKANGSTFHIDWVKVYKK